MWLAFYVASVSLDVVAHNAGTTVVDPQQLAVAVSRVGRRQGGTTGIGGSSSVSLHGHVGTMRDVALDAVRPADACRVVPVGTVAVREGSIAGVDLVGPAPGQVARVAGGAPLRDVGDVPIRFGGQQCNASDVGNVAVRDVPVVGRRVDLGGCVGDLDACRRCTQLSRRDDTGRAGGRRTDDSLSQRSGIDRDRLQDAIVAVAVRVVTRTALKRDAGLARVDGSRNGPVAPDGAGRRAIDLVLRRYGRFRAQSRNAGGLQHDRGYSGSTGHGLDGTCAIDLGVLETAATKRGIGVRVDAVLDVCRCARSGVAGVAQRGLSCLEQELGLGCVRPVARSTPATSGVGDEGCLTSTDCGADVRPVVGRCRPDATHREYEGASRSEEEKLLHCPASISHYTCSISFTVSSMFRTLLLLQTAVLSLKPLSHA